MEDTLTVARTMRAASPPASAADILEANAGNRRGNRPGTIAPLFIVVFTRNSEFFVVRHEFGRPDTFFAKFVFHVSEELPICTSETTKKSNDVAKPNKNMFYH
jgi:hypothetical protein